MPSRRAVLATLGSATLAGCGALSDDAAVAGSWPQRGHDSARTGTAAPDVDGPEPPLTTAWSFEHPSRGGTSVSPLLAGDSVYVGYTDGPPSPAAGERTVVIEALDPATGDRRWSVPVTTTREDRGTYYHADSLALAGGGETVLFQTSNGLCAIGTDGTEKWCFDNVGDGQLSYQPISPGVDAGTAYVGHYRQIGTDDREPTFYAVDVEDGRERWRHEFSAWEGQLVYSPAVADGVVYLTEFGAGVKALDAADGTELWAESLPVDSAPTVTNGTVFATTNEHAAEELGAIALDATTGEVRWSKTDGARSAWAPRHLAATDDAIYYPAHDRLVARDAETGDRLWTADGGRPSADDLIESGAPAVVGDRIYVGGSAVFVIDRSDGEVLGRYELDWGIENSIAVADGWLYVNTDRTLYGLTECATEILGHCLRRG
ncbi:PQQ-binding-like beta-propeller repeat protein [Halosolutus gelatinilyticus]|uniref:outer membrane protein assembly factor BamB family protein n=1 Tax=Halosolutus gelatinilyticus TaxID=2931975 RepID=UPI001FF2DA7D|nr:PQQ-binding-like beta-propeller repeat protein [Halosolutus gelatinilyticus]